MSQVLVGVDADEGQILLSTRQIGGDGDGLSTILRLHPRGARSLAAALALVARELDEDAEPAELTLKGELQTSKRAS